MYLQSDILDSSILETLRDKAEQALMPISAIIELTRQCNLVCRHCYQVKALNRTEMTTQQIMTVIDELHRAGCLFLVLTGGEPLVHSDFLTICTYASQRPMAIKVFTNGTLIDEAMVQHLANLNIMDVSLSVYGACARTHDAISQCPGSYDKTIQAALMLKRYNIQVRFKYIMMRNNIAEFKDMLALAQSLNVSYDLDPVITLCDDGDKTPTRLRLNNQELNQVYEELLHNQNIGVMPSKNTGCSLGRAHCAINAYGDVYACLQLPVAAGNVLEQSFDDIWSGSDWLKKLRNFSISQVPVCSTCAQSNHCRPCPGMAYVEEGDIYQPSREMCRQARIISEVGNLRQKQILGCM
jgi:radical SAM protein with 4Fe4S-binding SPASM domain